MGERATGRGGGVAAALMAAALFAACGSSAAPSVPPQTPPPPGVSAPASPTPPLAEPTTSPTATSRTPATSATSGPHIWFAPFPVIPALDFNGSIDYRALFGQDTAWESSAAAVAVFKFRPEWIDPQFGLADAELQREVAWLNTHDIAIGFDYEPLVDRGCTGGEGFGGGVTGALEIIRRIEEAGGTVRLIAFDEPFAGGYLAAGPSACHWSIEQTARELVQFVDGVHAVYPSIVMGDIEPWPIASTTMLAAWLDAYRSAAGSDLAFLHLDVDWRVFTSDEWAAQAHEVAVDVHRHGARFGIIYNGCDSGCDGQTDERWLGRAQRNVLDYELAGFGSPDDVIFQSWEDKPDRTLPETDASTFTHLVAAYLRTRTSMTVTSAPQTDGVLVSGEVRTATGMPAAAAPVTVAAVPAAGSYTTFELSGTVPDGQPSALVAIRTNTEGAGPGPADLRLYGIGYSESPEKVNRLPNPRFSNGPWGWDGNAKADVVASDRGGGRMLRLRASPAKSVTMNSAPFPVTPGAAYRMWVAARVPEASINSTLIYLIFLGTDGAEVSRVALRLRPQPVALGSTTLGSDGRYYFLSKGLTAGRYSIVVDYDGDETEWPARARSDVRIP